MYILSHSPALTVPLICVHTNVCVRVNAYTQKTTAREVATYTHDSGDDDDDDDLWRNPLLEANVRTGYMKNNNNG